MSIDAERLRKAIEDAYYEIAYTEEAAQRIAAAIVEEFGLTEECWCDTFGTCSHCWELIVAGKAIMTLARRET